jgi:hypothetical protein
MKNIGDIDPGLLARRPLRVVSMLALFLPAALSAQQYQQTDLVSDTIVEARILTTLISKIPGA